MLQNKKQLLPFFDQKFFLICISFENSDTKSVQFGNIIPFFKFFFLFSHKTKINEHVMFVNVCFDSVHSNRCSI